MRVGILKQDEGSIKPAAWAAESAAQIVDIIQIEPSSIVHNEMTAQKNLLEGELVALLTKHHQLVQDNEVARFNAEGLDILDAYPVPDMDHLEEVVTEIRDTAKNKLFGTHFDKPEVIEFLRHTMGSHFSTVKHIERSLLADKNPDTEQAKRFRARWHG